MSEEKILINKESYYQLIADLDQQHSDWKTLSEYVDQKIEINPSSNQYKNVRHEMDYIKGGIVE